MFSGKIVRIAQQINLPQTMMLDRVHDGLQEDQASQFRKVENVEELLDNVLEGQDVVSNVLGESNRPAE